MRGQAPDKSKSGSVLAKYLKHPLSWGAIATVLAALIGLLPGLVGSGRPSVAGPMDSAPPEQTTRAGAKVAGTVVDRSGKPVSGLTVGIRGGPQSETDKDGRFILDGIAVGDHVVEVTARGIGRLTQFVQVAASRTTNANIVYDSASSRIGLLSIGAPVDGAVMDLERAGEIFTGHVHGRSDGLGDILGRFEIWLLVRSSRDQRLWVQQPPALADATKSTWTGRVQFGSPEHPPVDGEKWEIIAVAAEAASLMRRILNTPSMSQLPQHISSNVVLVEIRTPR